MTAFVQTGTKKTRFLSMVTPTVHDDKGSQREASERVKSKTPDVESLVFEVLRPGSCPQVPGAPTTTIYDFVKGWYSVG